MSSSDETSRELTVLIPTRNRPDSLQSLLLSLGSMADEFSRVIVIDSSNKDFSSRVSAVVEKCESLRGKISFVHSEVPSLTFQKNLGLRFCGANEIVQILDDDVVPPKGYLTSMKESLLRLGLVGVSGVTQEMVPLSRGQKIFGTMFGLIAAEPGGVSMGGIGSPVYPNGESLELVTSSWLIGCSMWDLSKTGGSLYHPEFVGSALFEDVEYSLRLSKVGALAVDSTKVLIHQSAPDERPDPFTFWYRFSRNRFEVIKIRSKLPRTVLAWSTVGLFLQILLGAQVEKLKSLRGLVCGACGALTKSEFR